MPRTNCAPRWPFLSPRLRQLSRVKEPRPNTVKRSKPAWIPPEDLPHIFERFYRADKSRARSEGRVGLGLAICKAIIEAHGGRIEVASQLGKGVAFLIKLPAKKNTPG